MMKRILACLICLSMLFGMTALAAGEDGGLAACAYVGANGSIYLTDSETVFLNANAEEIVYQDDAILFYTVRDADGQSVSLVKASRTDGSRVTLVSGLTSMIVPIPEDGYAYFTDPQSANLLMAVNLENGQVGQMADLGCANALLSATRAGVRALCTEDNVNVVYNAQTARLDACEIAAEDAVVRLDGAEARLTAEPGLYLRADGTDEWTLVTGSEATALLVSGKTFFYALQLDVSGSAFAEVHAYDMETGVDSRLTVLPGAFFKTAAAGASYLYMLCADGKLYAVSLVNGAYTSTDVADGNPLGGGMLVLADDLLVVYSVSEDGVYALKTQTVDVNLTPSAAPTVAPTPQPTTSPALDTLRKGDRGEDVRALQAKLNALGYPAGTADGIFGTKTYNAIRYLQSQMGYKETGEADGALRALLNANKAPAYVAYYPLYVGNVGIRVEDLQNRLTALGYFISAVDGEYGAFTKAAVALFQTEAGLPVNGSADVKTLSALYASGAPAYSGYLRLSYGMYGKAVTNLQNRLLALGYFEGAVNGAFDDYTKQAVIFYQRVLGLTEDGVASIELQEGMFGTLAPAAPTYITLKKGDNSARVKAMLERLVTLGYFTAAPGTGYGDKTVAAIKKFESVKGYAETGIATDALQAEIFASDAPVNPDAPAPTPTPTPSTKTLQPGDNGDAVLALQQRLLALGYFQGDPAGNYYNVTAAAVKEFQLAAGFPVDGIATEDVQNAIFDASAPLAQRAIQVVPNEDVDLMVDWLNANVTDTTYTRVNAVKWLQMALVRLDFLPNTFFRNGVYNQETKDALKKFQTGQNLTTQDGVIDTATLETLVVEINKLP